MNRFHLVCLWLLALACAWQRLDRGWHGFDIDEDTLPHQQRDDGNGGHVEIDFSGQWLMGRMIVLGNGRSLYDRNRHWEIVRTAYPLSDEAPLVRELAFPADPNLPRFKAGRSIHHDAEWVIYWCMGQDSPRWGEAGRAIASSFVTENPLSTAVMTMWEQRSLTPELLEDLQKKAVGGPLYPPVHALLYSPLGCISSPRTAYHLFQIVTLSTSLVTGLGICRLLRGGVPLPLAVAVVLYYPGFRAGVELGQNPAWTLMILVWGWVFLAEGKPIRGGCIWGLLAYKPVWAAAFLLVPVLLRQGRFAIAMVVSAGILILATLPIVGIASWFDWLAIGREAAELYCVNESWIFLSRDLFGLPRRFLLDFQLPEAERHLAVAGYLGWSLWLTIFVTSVILTRKAWRAFNPTGLATGFLALTAYLLCYRFMYYDGLLSLFAFVILLSKAKSALYHTTLFVLCLLLYWENTLIQYNYILFYDWLYTGVRAPWDSLFLLGLWLVLAVRLGKENRRDRLISR